MRKDKLGINYACPWILGLIVDMKENVMCWGNHKTWSETAELDYNVVIY